MPTTRELLLKSNTPSAQLEVRALFFFFAEQATHDFDAFRVRFSFLRPCETAMFGYAVHLLPFNVSCNDCRPFPVEMTPSKCTSEARTSEVRLPRQETRCTENFAFSFSRGQD